MITLKSSTSDASSFGVYEDDLLIGCIHRQRTLTGDRYLASIDNKGQDRSNGKVFDSPDDALKWIEIHR
jgi:hypothetical protein